MTFARITPITFWACLPLGFTMAANAALIDRGGGLIYDSDRNITWLQDANYALTSGVNATGQLTWQNAVSWAANLSYGGFDDWRLPTTQVPDTSGTCGNPPVAFFTGCAGGELGHMYYAELGGAIVSPAVQSSAPGPGPFTHLQADGYWSGTEFDATFAYVLNFGFSGQQAADNKAIGYFAWAVRDGDVAVPAPAAAWLFGTGLLALAGRARRRR